MKKLETPKGLTINFSPSPKQYEVWKALQGGVCDKCGAPLELKVTSKDKQGHDIHEAVCSKCGNSNIPELILAGGSAGGGKSYLGCAWIACSCFKFPGIRMVLARKELKNLLATTWATLLNILTEWGLEENKHYHINNQRTILSFWNGSSVIGMELSPSPKDPHYDRLGGLEISGGFIDEVAEIAERAVEVLQSRIRYKIEDSFIVGKLLMSCNPTPNWPRARFVMDEDGNPVHLPKGYRYLPFSLFDNPNESFRRIYFNRLRKIRDKTTRYRLLYGNWDFNADNKMAVYYGFDGEQHLVNNLMETTYSPLAPLIISVDFNVNPYMSCLFMQIDWSKKTVNILKEYTGRPDDKLNNTPAFSRFIAQELRTMKHIGGVKLTGDPAGKARSTQTEAGINNFTLFQKSLEERNITCTTQLFNTQPSHLGRLSFINELFSGFEGWKVRIDLRCRRLTEDFSYQMKNPDGTKEKKKILMEDGTRAEKYGHLSDCFDYSVCYYLNAQYQKFINGDVEEVTTISGADVYGDFSY